MPGASALRRVAAALLALAALSTSAAEPTPRRVAITIDDLPWVEFPTSSRADIAHRHARLLAALSKHRSRAIGFVNEDKLYVDTRLQHERRAMLGDWLAAGLDLGNHTFGHVGLHATAIADYEHAILAGEDILRPLLAARGRTLQWFRHPYLQAGREEAVRSRLEGFLAAHGYRIAPVTIDNGDWIYARAYIKALDADDAARAAELRQRYIGYIEAKFGYYEDQSRRLFGREIPQILLLHASALNADALDELLTRIERRGYRYASLDEVLADPAYAHADGYRGGAGISWMHRWAMAEDKPRVFYDGEPVVPADVMAMAGVDSE